MPSCVSLFTIFRSYSSSYLSPDFSSLPMSFTWQFPADMFILRVSLPASTKILYVVEVSMLTTTPRCSNKKIVISRSIIFSIYKFGFRPIDIQQLHKFDILHLSFKTALKQILVNIVHISFNPFPHNDTFWRPWETSLLKTLWEKEKLLITSNFSFSHSVFLPIWIAFAIFVKFEIVVCKLFQFGRV